MSKKHQSAGGDEELAPDGTETFSKKSDDAIQVLNMLKTGKIKMSIGAEAVRQQFPAFHKYKKMSWSNTFNLIKRGIKNFSKMKLL